VESITPGLRYMLGRRARKDIPLAIDGPARSYPNQFGPVVVPRKVKMGANMPVPSVREGEYHQDVLSPVS
jgi:hypothetical protein